MVGVRLDGGRGGGGGPFTQRALPLMPDGGRIIALSSLGASRSMPVTRNVPVSMKEIQGGKAEKPPEF